VSSAEAVRQSWRKYISPNQSGNNELTGRERVTIAITEPRL
jgi:hypothetical protein